MCKITKQQQTDIQFLLNRLYDTEDHWKLIEIHNGQQSPMLEDLTASQADVLYHRLLLDMFKEKQMQFILTLAYDYQIGGLRSAEANEENYNQVSKVVKQHTGKSIYNLTIDEMGNFIMTLKRLYQEQEERKKVKGRSADYYRATKATNQLLASLGITKQTTPPKKAVKSK